MATQVRRIIATDNFGNPVVLLVFGGTDDTGPTGDAGATTPAPFTPLKITTEVGNMPVTYVRKGEYITHMGKRLTSDDPDAP
jgi:hypothetical protein